MYKTFKALFLLTVSLIVLVQIGLVSPKIVRAASTSDLEIGDYVQFGKYYNEAIKWRVINKNADGSLMLLSERILSMKPFDANGDSNGNSVEGESNPDRVNSGSNNWETSNLREWLNSDSEIVNYTSQPPDDSHVNGGINNYEKEAGFLSNFTESERNAIRPTVHRSILSSVDSSSAEGGTESFTYNTNIKDMVENYEKAYYKDVEDRAFLLDVKELYDYVFSRGYEPRRRPTEMAVQNSDYKITSENYWQYWLRTPEAVTAHASLFICYQGIVNFDNSYNGDHGVLPALNLNPYIPVVGGDGTDGLPYVVIGDISSVPTAPNVSGVQIVGDARIGKTLTANYNYSDINGDPETNSEYRWLESDTMDGVYTPIESENSLSYSIKENDVFKYIKFQVTPRTTVEPIQGNNVLSPAVQVYKSNNAFLSSLRYNGVNVPDFNPNLMEYEMVLPSGSIHVPLITATPEDDAALIQIINATDLNGKTTISVTAEDASVKTYTISFKVTPSYIESEHPYLNDFDHTWVYSLPQQYRAMQITFSELTEVEEECDFITIMDGDGNQVQGSPFTGKELMGKTIKVPGSTVKIRLTSDSDEPKYGFTVNDIQPDLSLKSIKVGGTDIPGFEQDKLAYRYVLQKDVSGVPLITVEADEGAITTIIPAASIPGKTEVKVEDGSGNLIKTYVIEFIYIGSDIQIGDYIQFGRYYREPILWRVINRNTDGSIMLLSEKILGLKPFDASGDLADGRGDSERINYGSNNWENSTLRQWLNSENVTVSYSSQPPDASHVYEGLNNYENEAGFLYNFTQEERDAIQPVIHRSILSSVDSSESDGGTELYQWKSEIGDIVQNFDNAYYKNITDKVYLLDVKELYDYVYNRGYEYKRKVTSSAIANSEYLENNSEYWYYWLRTPNADNSYLERFIFDDGGGYDFTYAYDGKIGLLPALNLKTGFSPSSGDGSEYNPYVVGAYSANPVVQMGNNPNYFNGAGFFIGLKDIKDQSGLLVDGANLANYQIEINYNPEKVVILDAIDEANLGHFTKEIVQVGQEGKLVVRGNAESGNINYERLFFIPLKIISTSQELTDLSVKFVKLQDVSQKEIKMLEPYNLTLQRGKVVNQEPGVELNITDAIAGLQYLANLRSSGFDSDQVNLINMASIIAGDNQGDVVTADIKDIIALLQKLVGLRDDSFSVGTE